MALKIQSKAKARTEVKLEDKSRYDPKPTKTRVVDEDLPEHDVVVTDPGRIALVSFRAGTTLSKPGTFSSAQCHVEITIPVLLDRPFQKGKRFDETPLEAAAEVASKIAEEIYEREGKALAEMMEEW